MIKSVIDDLKEIGILSSRLSEETRSIFKEILHLSMREVSEKYYTAGWLSNLEYYLWEEVVSDNSKRDYLKKDINKLRILSLLAGGWFRWSEEGSFEQFVSFEKWLEIYQNHLAEVNDHDKFFVPVEKWFEKHQSS